MPALRAAADDPEAASYQGIDVRAMHGLAFGVGIALVAAAALSDRGEGFRIGCSYGCSWKRKTCTSTC